MIAFSKCSDHHGNMDKMEINQTSVILTFVLSSPEMIRVQYLFCCEVLAPQPNHALSSQRVRSRVRSSHRLLTNSPSVPLLFRLSGHITTHHSLFSSSHLFFLRHRLYSPSLLPLPPYPVSLHVKRNDGRMVWFSYCCQ
jgi:hypothetical protein